MDRAGEADRCFAIRFSSLENLTEEDKRIAIVRGIYPDLAQLIRGIVEPVEIDERPSDEYRSEGTPKGRRHPKGIER